MSAYVPFARYFNPAAAVAVVGQAVTFANGEGLHFTFRVDRSISSEPDSCSIGIEGLDYFRAKLMGAAFRETSIGQVVTLRAGYDAALAGLFTGTLRSFRPNVRMGPALWTYAEADDGGDLYQNAIVSLPTTAGLTALDQINLACAVLKIVTSDSVATVVAGANLTAQGPFSASGVRMAFELLDVAARRLRARWWIRDGQLHMGRRGIPDPTRPAVVIAAPIPGGATFPGVPVIEPLTEDGSGVCTVTTFFDPNIVPGGQVVYAGQSLRVERVIHSGGTRSPSPWASQITGRTL